MMTARCLNALAVIACLQGVACADKDTVLVQPTVPSMLADDAEQNDSDGLAAGGTSSEQQPSDTEIVPRVINANGSTIEKCSFHAPEQDRVAFHQRDEASGTCTDLILVRVGKGGIVPEGLTLPWDWGVGHMSAYPCDATGKIVEGTAAAPMTRVSGSISMGGGQTGLPVSVLVNVTMEGPGPADQAASIYAWQTQQGLDVTASCDSAAPWASQPLNVNAEPSTLQMTGCEVLGGYNRVIIRQRDESTSICTELRLIQSFGDEGYGTLPPGLSLPENWAVERMYSFHCRRESNPRAEEPHYNDFTAAQGSVSFGFGRSEHAVLEYLWLDVSMTAPEPEDGLPADLRIESQRIVSSDTIVIGGGCRNLW